MSFEEMYDLAEYGNRAWKGGFSPREIACNAYEYMCALTESKEQGKPNETMETLCELLTQDGDENCLNWLNKIIEEIGEERK